MKPVDAAALNPELGVRVSGRAHESAAVKRVYVAWLERLASSLLRALSSAATVEDGQKQV